MEDQPNVTYPEMEYFNSIRTFVEKWRNGKMVRGQLYMNALRSSFSKSYEFNVGIRNTVNGPFSYFWLSSLRSICEDVIVLGYLRKMPESEREELINLLMI